jgi:hypothetical protein
VVGLDADRSVLEMFARGRIGSETPAHHEPAPDSRGGGAKAAPSLFRSSAAPQRTLTFADTRPPPITSV